MAITITIDNDTVAAGSQPLIEDESLGVQTPAGTATPPSTDTGNEVDVTLTNPVGGTLGGFQTTFNNFLNNVGSTLSTTFGLTLGDTQRVFAAANDGASSASNFVTVTASAGETVSDLFFSDSAGAALDGDQVFISAGVPLQTTSGDNIYLWSSGDFAIATTSSTAGAGRIVAAFYLNDTDPNHLQAQVQMVTFEALKHPNTGSFDDAVNFTNLLQVSAAGSTSFNFDALKSSGGIWAAVGNNQSAIVVSGYSLDVDSAGKIQNTSDKIAVSQGGTGTTIGINNQLFDNVGERAVFTLVSGLDSLTSASGGILSDYIVDHTGPTAEGLNYTGYINVVGAGIFVSQTQGNLPKDFNIDLYHAGGAGNVPEVGFGYIGTEPSGAFQDDSGVNVATVTIKADDGHVVGTWVLGADPDGAGPLQANGATVTYTSPNGTAHVQVTISGNDIDINGVLGGYTASWTSANGATFNRFTLTDSGSGQFDVGRVDLIQGLASHTPVGGNLVVQDDGPTITAAPSTQTVTHDETPGVQADTDVAGTAFITGGSGATVSSLFTNVPSQGDDLDVAGTGAIGFARSGGSLVNVTGGSAGTDGPAAQELTYALHVTDGTFSGVSTTEGTQIFLYNGTGSAAGLVLGRVGTEGGATDTANASGTVAFALAANSLTGEVFISQYLSLNHPTGGTSYDESISLVTTSVQMSVTRTDGDGDSATDSDNNIGNLISFQDDGPAIVAAPSAATVVHDETPGVQADTDVAGTAFVTGGSGATVASLFTNVPSQGDDLDVTGSGAIGFARSTSSLLTISTNNAGADGPAAQPLNYALAVTDGTFSGVSTTEGTQIFLYNGTGAAAGLVLGRVGTEGGATDAANSAGTVAFALATNPLTGEVFTAQYLSLLHPTGGSSYDESISLLSGAVQMSVTLTDKDGDTNTDSDNNIGNLIGFQDDGPAIVAAPSAATVVHDETPGVQADTDVAGSAFVTGGSGATVASLFTNVPSQGDDLDVAGTGAIGFARSVSSVLTISTNNAGADGPAAQPLNYALSVTDGTFSGVSTTEGTQIFLYNGTGSAAGLILGRVGTEAGATDNANSSGTVAFALATNPLTGEVFVAQYLSLNHPTGGSSYDESISLISGAVQMSVTLTDKDGDTATDSDNNIGDHISFQDDGPSITASQATALSITDDESLLGTDNTNDYSGNFSPVYGADGQGATPVTYALSTAGGDSGLVESSTGLHIFLFKVGNNIVGKSGTDATAAASGTTDFVVSVSSSGVVTLDQQHAVVHSPDTGVDQSTGLVGSNLIHLDATVHDGDTDTAAAFLDLTSLLLFKDDAPTITSQILDGEVVFTQNASVSHSLNGAIGNDGTSSTQTSLSGTAEYAISYWDTPTNVYPDLNAVLSANGTVLTYYSDAADTTAVYRLTLDPLANSGHGGYTFSVLQPPPITTTNFGFTDLPSGQNLDAVIATNKADLTQGGLLVFPSNPVLNPDGTYTNTSGTINTSKGGGPVTIGNGNQAFDSPQEGAYFMYVDNPAASSVGGLGLTQTTADDADTINFNGLNNSTDSSVSIVQASGAGTDKRPGPVVHIFTWEANTTTAVNSNATAESLVNNPVVATGATEVSIVGIKIHDSTGKVVEYGVNNNGTTVLQDVTGDGQVTAADNVGSVISFINDSPGGTNAYSAIVTQLKAGYTIEFLTSSSHNIALIQNVSGSFDIGGFSASNSANIPQQNFHFATTITDYDNDAYGGHLTQYADWNVTLDAVTFP